MRRARARVGVLLVLLLLLPSLPADALLPAPLPGVPSVNAAASATSPGSMPIPGDLLEAYRMARLRPDVRAFLEHHAAERGWVVPAPLVRDVDASALPAAIDAFPAVATTSSETSR